MEFRFDHLTDDQKKLIVEFWNKEDYLSLMEIYNKTKVAPIPLKECCAFKSIRTWTIYAFETGKLWQEPK